MNDDDQKSAVGMSRRQLLALFGTAGVAMLAGYSNASTASARSSDVKSPACVVTPEQTEGPFFVDEDLNRSDIRGDPSDGSVKAGIPLTLALRIFSIGSTGCAPL